MMSASGDAPDRELSIPGEDKRLDTKEDVADIVKAMEACIDMTTLRLSGNSLGVEAAEAIGEMLAHIPTLRRALWSDMFVSRLKTEIPQALTALGRGITTAQAHLVELDLSDNAFGPTGVEAVTTLLTSPSGYSLKVLKFNNNGLGIGGAKILSRALLESHEEASKAGQRLALDVFIAGRNRLENDGVAALSEVFEVLGTLVHVGMPQNGIHHEGVCALAKAFSKNPKMQVIDLNDNTFTEEGSLAMAEILPNLQELRVINFGDCLVRSDGARAIAEALKEGHKLLEEVNLSYDEVDQGAAMAVAEALANKEQLKRIDLNGNCLGEYGKELLMESLEAKGRLDALGSLSEDEGVESGDEEEEEGEDANGDRSIGDQVQESGTPERETVGVRQQNQEPVTLEAYLSCPSGENLVALGEERTQIITRSLGENPGSLGVAELYAKVTSCYTEDCNNAVEEAIQQTVDALLQPLSQAGHMNELINEILVQIGLIKSEDKRFKPVKDVEGPLLTLAHVVRQHYFPRGSADILIVFLTKPNPILERLTATRHKVLQVLHTL